MLCWPILKLSSGHLATDPRSISRFPTRWPGCLGKSWDGGLWSLRLRCLSRGVYSAGFIITRMRCASGKCGRCHPAVGKPVSGMAVQRACGGLCLGVRSLFLPVGSSEAAPRMRAGA